jgi:hypothetical protein
MFNIKKCGFEIAQTITAKSGHTSLTAEIPPDIFVFFVHPANFDWFLRLDGKLLMLKFSSISENLEGL